MTQPGETRGYTAGDHLRALHEHAGGKLFDYVVLNSRPISPAVRQRYAADRAETVAHDLEQIHALGVQPIYADLLLEDHVARHDAVRLAKLLLDLAARRA